MNNNYILGLVLLISLFSFVSCNKSNDDITKVRNNFEFKNTINYDRNGSAQFEYNGEQYSYSYNKSIYGERNVVLNKEIPLDKGTLFAVMIVCNIEGEGSIDTKVPINQLVTNDGNSADMYILSGKYNYYRMFYTFKGTSYDVINGFFYYAVPLYYNRND